MFTYQHSVTGPLHLEKVWQFYEDVSLWCEWDVEIETVTLNGNFAPHTTGAMRLKNGQQLPFVLDEVTPQKSFSTRSQMGPLVITFGHVVDCLGDGLYTITHTVAITGGDPQQMEGMGKAITAAIPQSMQRLLSLSR